MDFCLIFISFSHYDDPEILLYENSSIISTPNFDISGNALPCGITLFN